MTPEEAAIRARDAADANITSREAVCAWFVQLRIDVRALLAEVDRLRALVNDGIPWTCIYCGRLWPVSEPVDVLREHVIVCEKHPAARALPVIEAARGLIEHHPPRDPALAALRATLAAYEGDKP